MMILASKKGYYLFCKRYIGLLQKYPSKRTRISKNSCAIALLYAYINGLMWKKVFRRMSSMKGLLNDQMIQFAARRILDASDWGNAEKQFVELASKGKAQADHLNVLMDCALARRNYSTTAHLLKLCNEMGIEKNRRLFNRMIQHAHQFKKVQMAYEVREEMEASGIRPDAEFYDTFVRTLLDGKQYNEAFVLVLGMHEAYMHSDPYDESTQKLAKRTYQRVLEESKSKGLLEEAKSVEKMLRRVHK
eukprot:TRINITY_DN4298_c0_g1_i1.p1 TRINITY_DN4298_c0_g1~~TRINITY_DN4298_c0_g1_i1.p1  ORF type:complete len:247 (+),score=30.51 TRINITY_DN4298_c0_g1_i1:464-1204(+)